jgi:hypothetical protein
MKRRPFGKSKVSRAGFNAIIINNRAISLQRLPARRVNLSVGSTDPFVHARPRDQAFTSTTTRPLTLPAKISAPTAGTSARQISVVAAAKCACGKSLANRAHAATRRS